MKSNEYLYGIDIEVPEIPAEITMRRLELLNDNLTEVNEVNYQIRDFERRNDILKAIKFWEEIND